MKRIKEAFDEVVELEGEARAARLAELRQSDPELCREVEALLSGDERAQEVLQPFEFPEHGDRDPAARLNVALEGRYSIERELGEGGMATVYLTDDLKHERKVALKVLKPELAAVVGAKRFLSEIKVTANLQHPHILPLFDSGEADGFLFYVMPYVEGQSLRDRIDREKQLPVDEAVRIATAVANALDHAHRHDVIHRDIKPANILLQDGEPVVADFGIALAVGAAGSNRLTETGLSLGTPYYMSPEQATGDQPVGASTDTYALGSVLYEMLVGEPPYMGSTAQAVLGQIISAKPISATEKRPSIPANVDAAVRKALEKLPADRFASAQDFVRALGDEHFRYGEVAAGVARASVGPWKRLTIAMTTLAALLALTLGWSLLRPTPAPPVQRFSLARDEGQVPHEWLALSPDGSALVMAYPNAAGQRQLFIRRWGDLTAVAIPGTEGRTYDPIVSRDGTEVAFVSGDIVSGDAQLMVAPLQGGLVRTLAESAYCCPRWGVDGFLYYSAADRTIRRVPASGGQVEQITEGSGEGDGSHAYFQILPGGEVGVFTVWSTPGRIEAMDMASGRRVVLTEGIRQYVTPTGHLVFASADGRLFAAPFDDKAMELTSAPVPLVENLGITNLGEAMYDLSNSGDLVYWRVPGRGQSEFVWVSRSGEITQVDPGWMFTPGVGNQSWSLSPNDTRLAFRDMADGGDIWIKELDDGPLYRFTFDAGRDGAPRWAPDGETVTFLSDRAGTLSIWSKRADGVGEPEMLMDYQRSIAEAFWSPDGAWLIFRAAAGGGASRDILGFRPGVDSAAVPLVATDFMERAAALSPDGRWLAYTSDETGQLEVYVRPFPDVNTGRWLVSNRGRPNTTVGPQWSGAVLPHAGWTRGGGPSGDDTQLSRD